MNAVVAPEAAPLDGREALVDFGPDGRLTGVLAGAGASGPVLLLPSAGLQPRAGPFRLHAELARELSAHGIRSFRFDVPGVGEAPRLQDCDAAGATIAAMDRLASLHRCGAFAVGGICSAADTAWEVANRDHRVCALLLLDGLVFAGPWFRYARVLSLVRRLPREWRHFAKRLPARLRGNGGFDSDAFRSWPPHHLARRQFAELIARDVRMLFVFSGDYGDRFLDPRQFEWSFGPPSRDPRVEMLHWPDCDHTYFGRAHRDRLIARVVAWMLDIAGGPRP
ncbi:alpha/beta hydrolase [Luteimonas pelagia]